MTSPNKKAAPKADKVKAAKIVPQKPQKLPKLTTVFLANTPAGIKSQFDENVLSHVVARHEKLSGPRKPGQTTIEVFNPSEAKHGWNSRHTVLNLISDDKAFIVDSVIKALSSL